MFVPPQRGGEQHSFKERTKPILINFTPAEEPIKRKAYKGKLD